MKPSEIASLLQLLARIHKPAFLWGPPGVGKSQVVAQVATALGIRLIDIRVVLLDPVDLRGLPTVEQGRAAWAIPAFLPEDGAGILFLDELNAAPPLVQAACYQTAQYLAKEIAALGPFEMIFNGDPGGGIPAICWRIPKGINPGYTLYDLAERLTLRGWQVPAYSLPANQQNTVVQRIIVRLGVSRDMAGLLLDNFRAAVDYLTTHPSMRQPDGAAFHH